MKRSLPSEIGKRYGSLTVVARKASGGGGASWLCVCDCGNEKVLQGCKLREGGYQSCGCGRRRRSGLSGHPLYSTWGNMIRRCTDPTNHNYHFYGGRGIRVCERWAGEDGLQNFLADMGERPVGTTLDRIDVNGDYEPSNCRWADTTTQMANRRASGSHVANVLEAATQRVRLGRAPSYSRSEVADMLMQLRTALCGDEPIAATTEIVSAG